MDVAVLVSPTAGRGRAEALTGVVLDALRSGGLNPRVLRATSAAEAEHRAARRLSTAPQGSSPWSSGSRAIHSPPPGRQLVRQGPG